jgi:sugar O-acyltransferase (sialic acid O-acetyltransferase NeuD family)
MADPILIPLLNPNEPEAALVAIHVVEGQRVQTGDLLCTLETTKSTSDLAAEAQGYVAGLHLQAGQTVRAGQVFCFLAESPEEKVDLPSPEPSVDTGRQPDELPPGLRITQPALELAQKLGVRLPELPAGPLITEAAVRRIHESVNPAVSSLTAHTGEFDPTAILIYGGGGHGKSIIDLLRATGVFQIVGIVDDGLATAGVDSVMGLPVLGGSQVLAEQYRRGVRLAVNAVGGIGNVALRIEVFQRLSQAGFAYPAIVHPAAFIEPSASLSPGVQVFALAYVGSEAQVGFGAIINTNAILSHECVIGDYANISPGAILAGQVEIGSEVLVGMGATVNLQVKIGAKARVGNGATVKSDVPPGAVVRAGSVWPKDP